MTIVTGRISALAIALTLTLFVVSLYGATLAIAWVRELPNRIVIDDAALGSAFGSIITESYHVALRDADAATQAQILTDQFLPAIKADSATADWIRSEYRDDLLRLAAVDESSVSSAATKCLAALNPGPVQM